jgi:hypothetical protein
MLTVKPSHYVQVQSRGKGTDPLALCGKQVPKPGIIAQLPGIQTPLRRILSPKHAKHSLLLGPEQLAQLESQDLQDKEDWSKYWVGWPHVGWQIPEVELKTGRFGGHVKHWSKEGPEQLAQSRWHPTQTEFKLKNPVGQVETHVPDDESNSPRGQERQWSAVPAQVLHFDEQPKCKQLCQVSRRQKQKNE